MEGGVGMPGYGNAICEREKSAVKKYVRYKEGAEIYSISQSLFERLAKQSGAVYKIGRAALVNCEIFDKYLESFRIQ